ncbi:MAG: ABC transporter permease [Oscillospiraceae bacterium]
MSFLLALPGAVAQGLIYGVMTLGAYIGYKVLNFADLSIDGTFALGASVSMILTVNGVNPFLTLPIAMLAGMGGGVITALLTTKIRIPGLLSGILTMLSLYSINLMIMGKSNTPVGANATAIDLIKKLLPISSNYLTIILGGGFCALLIAAMYWFFGTELGCALRATGNNPHMARALGVNTDGMLILGLAVSNGLVALSGGLWSQYQGVADVGMGTGTMVIGLASIIIGEALFRILRKSFALKLLAAVLGSVVYWIVVTVVLQMGLGTNNLKLFTAVVVVIALAIPQINAGVRGAAQAKGE